MSVNRGLDGIPHRRAGDRDGHGHRAQQLPGDGGGALRPPRRAARPLHRVEPAARGRDDPGGVDDPAPPGERQAPAGLSPIRAPSRRATAGSTSPSCATPTSRCSAHASRSGSRQGAIRASPPTTRASPTWPPSTRCSSRRSPGAPPPTSPRGCTARLMHQKVNTYLEFLDDPHVKAIGAVTWIEQPGSDWCRAAGARPAAAPQRMVRGRALAR